VVKPLTPTCLSGYRVETRKINEKCKIERYWCYDCEDYLCSDYHRREMMIVDCNLENLDVFVVARANYFNDLFTGVDVHVELIRLSRARKAVIIDSYDSLKAYQKIVELWIRLSAKRC